MITANSPKDTGVYAARPRQRVAAADLARGFAALSLPAIHTVLLYSRPAVHQGWLGNILAFLAEPAAAPVFLFLMGFSAALAPPKKFSKVLKRAAMLLLAGYLLNWLRLGLPALAGMVPAALLADYIVYPRHPALSVLLTGDILHTAAVTLVVVSCLHRWSLNPAFLIITYMAIAITSPYLWGTNTGNLATSHLTGLLFSEGYRAFFPVFPWLCYPVAGLVAAPFYKRPEAGFFLHASLAGLILLVAGLLAWHYGPQGWERDFYRGGPGRTVSQTGFVLIWLAMWKALERFLRTGRLSRLLRFCSRHVTLFYCVQWVVVGWGIPLAGYRRLGLAASLLAVAVTTTVTLLVTSVLSYRKSLSLKNHPTIIHDQKNHL